MHVAHEIKAERRRQIEVEGWTEEHDDLHADGEMLKAAVIYLWHGTHKAVPLKGDGVPLGWPWEAEWWKPKDRRSNLIRAGALCLAERDRVIRRGPVYQDGYAIRRGRRVPYRRPRPPNTEYVDREWFLVIDELRRLDAITPPRASDTPGEETA